MEKGERSVGPCVLVFEGSRLVTQQMLGSHRAVSRYLVRLHDAVNFGRKHYSGTERRRRMMMQAAYLPRWRSSAYASAVVNIPERMRLCCWRLLMGRVRET